MQMSKLIEEQPDLRAQQASDSHGTDHVSKCGEMAVVETLQDPLTEIREGTISKNPTKVVPNPETICQSR